MNMRILTKDAVGAPLDWAVAVAAHIDAEPSDLKLVRLQSCQDSLLYGGWAFKPSTNWMAGGWIVEHLLKLGYSFHEPLGSKVEALLNGNVTSTGDTVLVAACRAYVIYKLGDVIQVPDILFEEPDVGLPPRGGFDPEQPIDEMIGVLEAVRSTFIDGTRHSPFICDCVRWNTKTGSYSDTKVGPCKGLIDAIEQKINGQFCAKSWLRSQNPGLNIDHITPEFMRAFRIRWMDDMIVELKGLERKLNTCQ